MKYMGSTIMIMDPGLGSFLAGDTTPEVYFTIDKSSFHVEDHWYMMRRIQVLWTLSSPGTRNARNPSSRSTIDTARVWIFYQQLCLYLIPYLQRACVWRIWGLSWLLSDCWLERHFQHQVVGRSALLHHFHYSNTNELSGLLTLENDTPTARVL